MAPKPAPLNSELVNEIVLKAHDDFKRVMELIDLESLE